MKTPWGRMWTLASGRRFWIKVIHVWRHHRTSLQYHTKRDELHISRHGVKLVPSHTLHRMEEGWYLELAWGPDVREADIVRTQDDYHRSN